MKKKTVNLFDLKIKHMEIPNIIFEKKCSELTKENEELKNK